MDGAQALYRYFAVGANATRQRVGGRGGCDEALAVMPGRTTSSADLGGSSKYSNKTL